MNDGGKNDPLPQKSRERAELQARSLVGTLSREYGLTIDESSGDAEFRECTGKDGERAHDGRFDLSYIARVPVPEAEHGNALRAMRKRLEAEGFTISDYREDKSKDPWALMYAKGGQDNFFVSVVSGIPPNSLIFSVSSPCFLPPGRKQDQVSAPAPRPHRIDVATAPADERLRDSPFG